MYRREEEKIQATDFKTRNIDEKKVDKTKIHCSKMIIHKEKNYIQSKWEHWNVWNSSRFSNAKHKRNDDNVVIVHERWKNRK